MDGRVKLLEANDTSVTAGTGREPAMIQVDGEQIRVVLRRKVYPNLASQMVVADMDQLCEAGITYIRLEDDLTPAGLRMALSQRTIQPGLVHHSDRGSQYAPQDYTDLLKAQGIGISLSRKENPWDNAARESFMKSLNGVWGFCSLSP
jgi:transposase InsO family protein